MSDLNNKKILLGITGGIAAYKSAELVRSLKNVGADIRVVMTQSAQEFISTTTLQALSGHPVYTSLWSEDVSNGMSHIELSRECDIILVAPATANFMSKIVTGQADDLLSTLCLAKDCPLAIAPAMNRQMWENPATKRNVAKLASDGVILLGPEAGDQACGEVGLGRMSEPAHITRELISIFQPKLLESKRVLVTAGSTYEAIDAVRGITNASSGKMGYAVAQAAREAGAKVKLISGRSTLTPPNGMEIIDVVSALDMYEAVMKKIDEVDIFISVAAVADFRVRNPQKHKIKKTDNTLDLEFDQNPDILREVSCRENPPFCVGFSAESQNIEEFAKKKRLEKQIPLIAANLVTSALGSETNALMLIDEHGSHQLSESSKIEQARSLVKHISKLI